MRPFLATFGMILSWTPLLCGQAVYTVEEISGKVWFLPAGAKEEIHAEIGDELEAGDRLRAEKNARAVLWSEDGIALQISDGGDFLFERNVKDEKEGLQNHLKLFWGSIVAKVNALKESRLNFEIEAGGVVTGVRGTVFEVGVAEGDEVTTAVYEGEIDVRGEKHRRLRAGHLLRFYKRRLHLERRLDRLEKKRFEQWLERHKEIQKRRLERLEKIKKSGKWHKKLKERREKIHRLRHHRHP